MLRERGELAAALAFAQRSVRFQGGVDAAEEVARVRLSQGEYEASITTLTRILEVHPGRASSQYWLGRAYFETGSEGDAIQSYRIAALSGDSPWADRARAELSKIEERTLE